MNNRQTGSNWEQQAVLYLTRQGYEIVQCNYRCTFGEIDIIAKEQVRCNQSDDLMTVLCFIEVKFRAGKRYGYALEAVTAAKQRTIRRVAQHYLAAKTAGTGIYCRFDVLGFDRGQPCLVRNAF